MIVDKSFSALRSSRIFRYYSRNIRLNYRCFSSQPAVTHTGLSYHHHIGKEPLVYRTLGQELELSVSKYGSNEAIVSCHEGKRQTFRSLISEVDRLAAGFLKIGLKPGDTVGISGPNNLQWYLTMLAIARCGMISVGINPAFQAPEVAYCIKKVKINAIVSAESFKTQNYYEIFREICPELSSCEPGKLKSTNFPDLKAVIIDSKQPLKGAFTFENVLDLSTHESIKEITKLQKYINPDQPSNVQFTSGTTGKPKAAVLSHYNLVNNGIHVGNRNQLENQRICVQVPLFHAFGVSITIMAAMSKGATMVLPNAGFDPESSLKAIVNEKCTVIHGTPTMYVDLIKKQKELKLPLKTAKRAITGGAPCSPQLFMDIKNYLGLEEVRTVYGLTETTAVIFQSRAVDSVDQILNTVGHLQDHIEAKVIDAEGNMVPFGQPGELCIRGYLNMLGYFDDELKTKEILAEDNWLKTGDQFVLQEDGYGRIVGRLKDLIIRGGENIFPKEVEDFLNEHPHINESHVIGVPDERMGEEICAFVSLQKNIEKLTREELKKYCKGKVAHYKVPRYIIAVQSFPKTMSGKIQKFKLKEIFDQQYSKNN